MKGIYNWIGKHAQAPYGPYIFGILIFIEGFFIVPASTLLAFYCLENRSKSFFYGTIATLISAFAAIAGYFIGVLLWKATGSKFINLLISPKKFDYLVQQYKTYQAWTIFFTALTPMPFKILTLSAGFCKLPLLPFVFFTLIARGIRFYFIALCIYIWGDKVNYFLNKYFYYIIIFGIAVLIFIAWLLH